VRSCLSIFHTDKHNLIRISVLSQGRSAQDHAGNLSDIGHKRQKRCCEASVKVYGSGAGVVVRAQVYKHSLRRRVGELKGANWVVFSSLRVKLGHCCTRVTTVTN
jgi:hypothetical protein